MAKFLRVIFNLLLMCYIAAALALFVPPLVGVTTAVTLEGMEGNQELGTVNYAWRTPLRSLQQGDQILVADNTAVNVYTVESADPETAVVATTDAEVPEVAVRTYVHRLVLTVPYLGYIAVGLQTMEGTIILAAAAGTLLVLCILTAIWCRKRKVKRMIEEEDDLADEDANEFFQNLASQKRESDERAELEFRNRQADLEPSASAAEPMLDEEYEDFPAAATAAAEEEPAEELQEEAAEESAEEAKELQEQPEETDASGSETEKKEHELLEVSEEEMEVERAVETGNIPGVQAALEAALDTQQLQRHVKRREAVREPEEETEPLAAEEIELAMPVYTVEEYLQKAYAAGEDPEVRKDELTGVTYVDYSGCV